MTSVAAGRTQPLRNDTTFIEILIDRQNKVCFHNYPFRDSDYDRRRRRAPRRLAFALQKLLKAKAPDFAVAPRLGEQLPSDGEHRHLSRGLVRHDDDATARKSVHGGRPSKPGSGRAGRNLEGEKFYPGTFG